MQRGRREHRLARHLLVGSRRARRRRVRLGLVRRDRRPARGGRHRDRPRHADRGAARTGCSPKHPEILPVEQDMHAALAGRPTGLVPEQPGLPAVRPAHRRRRSPSATASASTWSCGTSATSSAAATAAATATCRPTRSAAGCRRRYGTLDALNAAWGSAFWGHTYRTLAARPAAARPDSPRTRRSCSTSTGSRPTSCSAHYLAERECAEEHHARPAGDDELHGRRRDRRRRLRALGAPHGRRSPTTTTRARPTRCRSRTSRSPATGCAP